MIEQFVGSAIWMLVKWVRRSRGLSKQAACGHELLIETKMKLKRKHKNGLNVGVQLKWSVFNMFLTLTTSGGRKSPLGKQMKKTNQYLWCSKLVNRPYLTQALERGWVGGHSLLSPTAAHVGMLGLCKLRRVGFRPYSLIVCLNEPI